MRVPTAATWLAPDDFDLCSAAHQAHTRTSSPKKSTGGLQALKSWPERPLEAHLCRLARPVAGIRGRPQHPTASLKSNLELLLCLLISLIPAVGLGRLLIGQHLPVQRRHRLAFEVLITPRQARDMTGLPARPKTYCAGRTQTVSLAPVALANSDEV